VALLVTLLALAAPLQAQDALTRVSPSTQVRSVEFRFEDKQTLLRDDLAKEIALTGQGSLVGLRRFFGFLPFVPKIGSHPFDPLEMQRDVIRLRTHYQRSGFPDARVRYDVNYKAKSDLVKIAYVVHEGTPLMVDSLDFAGDSGALTLPRDLTKRWSRFVRRERKSAGRWGEDESQALTDSTVRWFGAHGYPFSDANPTARVDSARHRASVTVAVRPGPRLRIREIEVSGNETVPSRQLVRELPVGKGDWYDGAALEQGRQQLTQMDIVRLAQIQVPRSEADDSSVAVRLKVTENPPHLIRGEAGIVSVGGLDGQVEWSDRSFLGGMHTLTVSGTAQTGVLALESPSQRLYRLGVSVFQPYVWDRRLSAAGGPFAEYRDDVRDRSWAVGLDGSLVYSAGPFRSITLSYTLSHRKVLDFGLGGNLDPIQYLPLLHLADSSASRSLESTRNRSALTLEASWGRLDRIANPRKGYVLRPRLEFTTPGFNTSEYVLVDLGGTAFVPLSNRIGITLRAAGGRIFPYGRSTELVGIESPFVSLLRLRDVTFTAGGTRDVRGWGSLLVGPKVPEVHIETSGGVSTAIADRYTPIGGLARVLTSAELHFPMPGMGDKWQPYLFWDGGRIWTPDSRFRLDAGDIDQDRFYSSVGIGLGYVTVVGAIQVAVGYKLNPSPLDLRSAEDVLGALEGGTSIESLPTDNRRRLHFHFSVGTSF
jgi:outer membrane protein assembly complex protein YaeT